MHEIRVSLGRKRHELDRLEREGFIRAFGDNYLPGLRAIELEGHNAAKLVRECTGPVLWALKSLYKRNGAKQYSAEEVRAAADAIAGDQTDPEVIAIGLLFATALGKYIGSWVISPDGLVTSVTPNEDILDFESIHTDWEEVVGKLQPAEPPETAESPAPEAAETAGATRGSRVRWEEIRQLGSGGQGTVWLVRDASRVNLRGAVEGIKASVAKLATPLDPAQTDANAATLAEKIRAYQRADDPENCAALKVLHEAANPDDLTKQLERMKREIEALQAVNHPNVVKVLDANLKDRWFVTEYFPDGPLSGKKHWGKYRGQLLEALLAFRPLVEGVAAIHDARLVHRDIKPENIFVSPERGLVLGDFGLVFFADEQKTRVSETFENVGSRDWMPPWAMTVRLETVQPSFDVFSLGKVFWSMLAGGAKLRLWYCHQEEFELENMFSSDPDMRWARTILDKCVVEHEADCLPDADALLKEVERVLAAVRHANSILSPSKGIRCRFCGVGTYGRANIYEDPSLFKHFGLPPTRGADRAGRTAMLRCNHCGHVEWFQLHGLENSGWWER